MREYLTPVVKKWNNKIWVLILGGMTSYVESGMIERNDFTKAVIKFLALIKSGMKFNPTGSFNPGSANTVLMEEGRPWDTDLAFGYDVTGRLEDLENGINNFRWIWDNFLRDAVNEKSFIAKFKGKMGSLFNALRKGPPEYDPPRPYVGNVMEKKSPDFAYAVKEAVTNSLMDKYRVKVSIR